MFFGSGYFGGKVYLFDSLEIVHVCVSVCVCVRERVYFPSLYCSCIFHLTRTVF